MSELPAPGERTRQLIALAEEVAKQPLPLRTRILLPLVLLVIGIASFWFGFRESGQDSPPTNPNSSTTVPVVETSVVFTAPP